MFFVNVPFGLLIIAAAICIMPSVPPRAGTRLDFPGAIVLFAGLLCLIGPLVFGHDLNWSPWVFVAMGIGVAIIAGLPRLERAVAARGGMPPLDAGLVFVPLTLTFVAASRLSSVRAKHRGILVLIEGCAIQITGLAALTLLVATVHVPSALMIAPALAIFGFGQGLVMAPLSSTVLATVKPHCAGAGSGLYGTTAQIANAAGIAAMGAVYVAVESVDSAQHAVFVVFAMFALSIMTSVAFLSWMRRAVPET